MSGRFRKYILSVPVWLPTGVTLAAILWLTLSPRPLGSFDAPLFPGSDKVVHGLMFFGLTIVFYFDKLRFSHRKHLSVSFALLIATLSSLLGVAIEYLQRALNLGRSFDPLDMLADAVGAFAAAILWLIVQPDLSSDRHG